jgi:hypothetical protein
MRTPRPASVVNQNQERSSTVELERLVARQGLLIETLARLLMAKGVVQEDELNQWLEYVDGLDGQADGRLKARKGAKACAKCQRMNPAALPKCMYCSEPFPPRFLTEPDDPDAES